MLTKRNKSKLAISALALAWPISLTSVIFFILFAQNSSKLSFIKQDAIFSAVFIVIFYGI